MPTILDNLDEFSDALENNIPIECDPNGQWRYERSCHKITRLLSLNYYDRNQLVTIVKAFTNALDHLEKSPVIFQDDMKIIQPQYKNFLRFFKAFRVIESKLSHSPNPHLKQTLAVIKQHMVGLTYRIETIHGGLDKKSNADETLLNYACHLASAWKAKQKLYPNHAKNLTERDRQKIREACLYPEFIQLLSDNTSLQHLFFTWTLRDNNGAAQFIEFPATCSRLHACTLGKRIGRLAPQELAIVKEKLSTPSGYQKIICLPFYIDHQIKRINILEDSHHVTLNDGLHLSIRDIFNTFFQKRIKPGNVEFFGTTGIMNWSNFEFGSWNPKLGTFNRINLTGLYWWKQLPVLEELSKQQIEARYQISLKDGEWVRCISSTREDLDFNVSGRHGYIEMAIPLDNNRYAIYPFGKFPAHYPTHTLPRARLVTQTVEARISYPDENTFYSHRQHARNPQIKTPDEGIAIMERIRKDIVKALNGNLSFQLGYENCAHWAEEIIVSEEGQKAPNPFKMPIQKMSPTHKGIDFLLRAAPTTQSSILNCFRLFAYLDGKKIKENRKHIYKSTPFVSSMDKLYQYQPAHLNRQIEEGSLSGVITYGN